MPDKGGNAALKSLYGQDIVQIVGWKQIPQGCVRVKACVRVMNDL